MHGVVDDRHTSGERSGLPPTVFVTGLMIGVPKRCAPRKALGYHTDAPEDRQLLDLVWVLPAAL